MNTAVALALAFALAPPGPPGPVPGDSLARRRGGFADGVTHDIVGGGGTRGAWAAHAYGGWPWLGLRASAGVGPRGLAVGFEGEAARLRRFRAALLVALRWVDRRRVRLTGEAALGYVAQTGVLAEEGANAELRVRLAFPGRRVLPYLTLATAHTLLLDRTVIEAAEGTTRDLAARHAWTPRATLGLAVALTPSLGLEAGIDLFWAAAPSRTPSLPGVHLGLAFGGAR